MSAIYFQELNRENDKNFKSGIADVDFCRMIFKAPPKVLLYNRHRAKWKGAFCMLEFIVRQKIIFYVMGILFALGILAKLISVFTMRKLVREAKEIHSSEHRLMKLVKAKFEHASMVHDRVQNVSAFVNKFVYEYKVMGLRLQSYRSLPAKMMWLIVLMGAFASFESYRLSGFQNLTIFYLQWTGCFFLVLAVLQIAREEQFYLEATKNYMVEYLENVCAQRYLKRNQEIQEPEEVEPEILEVQEELEVQTVSEEEQKSEQELRIRAILEEFLA